VIAVNNRADAADVRDTPSKRVVAADAVEMKYVQRQSG
jgi:hypothetical protein